MYVLKSERNWPGFFLIMSLPTFFFFSVEVDQKVLRGSCHMQESMGAVV